jgi:hypothetical protein
MLGQITRLGFSCEATPRELQSAREQFERHNYLCLRDFIEAGLLRAIRHQLAGVRFERKIYSGLGRDLIASNSPLPSVLYFLSNDPELFRLIRRVTGCRPIGCFTGRLSRLVARRKLELDWHDDVLSDRMVAMSVNLSDGRYRGGTLQIREKSRVECEAVPNLGFGDAIIFRVAEQLEHRVTPIEGKVARTAFTGWFRSRPSHASVLRELIARSEHELAFHSSRNAKGPSFPLPSDIAKIPTAIVCRRAARETFVADIGTGMYYGLNRTGSRIWELLAEGHTMRTVSIAIAREYAVRRGEVELDVLALAHDLAVRGLIELVHGVNSQRVAHQEMVE